MVIKFQSDVTKPKTPGQRLIAAAKEAVAISKGEAEPAAVHVRQGRPPSERPKKLVSIRLDQDVVEGFKALGDGWQSRINAALRVHLNLPSGDQK